MSFLAGYLSKTYKIETDSLEERVKLYSPLSTETPDEYKTVVLGTKFGHVIQKYKKHYSIQNEPCVGTNGNMLLTLGYLHASDRTSHSPRLLDLCIGSSAQALEQCEGEFVAVFTEGHSGKVHIINDRFASRPFYILRSTDYTYFSSDLAFLLYLAGGKHEADILGWLQIFAYSHTLGTRTTFKDIKRIRPATHLTISTGGIQEKQYWRLEYNPENDLDPVTYSKQVFEAFQAGTALRSKLIGKGVVALSGGLDSRLVAGALPRDARFSAFTFVDSTTTSETAEVRTATEVAALLGLKHLVEPLPNEQVSRVARDVTMLTGGLTPIHGPAKVMTFVDQIKRRGLNFLLGGGGAR